MRYEDASQAGSITSGSEPIARPDVETLPPSSNGPGSGNAISGMGTNSGASGADQVADGPGAIVELRGVGGAGASNGNGFEAAGQYGTLSMDQTGNFNYVRTSTADGVQDVFQYTLADANGARSSTTLTVEIPRVIDEQAMVNLPAGVQMSDIKVIGRDLVIQMPDGTQMVIPGGAVFVPELSIGDVVIPPTNLAALLIDSEPQPAAGPPQSSGGNFADDVPDLDPGVPLGDLIPPTELDYTPPEYEEPMEIEDTEPTIIIITPDNPAGAVNAIASVDESGLPERGSEPEGTLESQNIETTTGSIVFTAEDGLETITINGTAITAVGQEIEGEHGVLTITSIDLENGTIGYSYTATDNTTDGVDDFEDFTIVVTDEDGDAATGTLHIDILDDEPIARDDVDQVNLQTNSATGNVMTGVGTNAGVASGDTVGADDATLTAVVGEGGSDSSFDSAGNLVVDGEYGTLTIDAEGNYTYVPFADSPGGTEDVFTYTLTDGDGDVITATLTIINPDQAPTAGPNPVVQLDDDVLGGNPGGPNDDPNSVNATGTLSGSGGDGQLTFDLLITGAPAGFTYVDGPNGSVLVQQVQDGVTVTVLTITVDPETGAYTVVQNANILHPDGQTENNVVFSINYTVTDADGDVVSSTLTVNVDDDTPLAFDDTETMTTNETQETGNVITGAGTNEGTGNADQPGADGFGGIVALEGANSSDSNGSNGFEVQGEFGTLTMDAEGNYTYVRDPNILEGGEDVFTYTYVDGDGDTVTATLTILVPDIDLIPVANPPADVIVDDDDVGQGGNPGGTGDDAPQNATGTLTATGGNGDSDFFFDVTATNAGLPAGFTLGAGSTSTSLLIMQGSTLVMTVTLNSETGQYTVVQNAPIDHSAGGNENNVDFDIIFNAVDADGSVSPDQTLNISVDDDTPLAANDSNSIPSGQFGPVIGNVITNDDPGADGFGLVTGIVSDGTGNSDVASDGANNYVVQGDYGVLTINEDGSYSYLRDAGTPGGVSDSFTYTYVDGDGDTVTAVLTITIGDSTPDVPENVNVLVDDDDVGTEGNPGGTGDDAPANTSGSVAAVGGDGTITYTLSDAGAPAGFTYQLQGDGSLHIIQDSTGDHVLTVTLDANGDYTVTQVNPIVHAAGSDENNLITDLVVTFTATDEDGGSDSGTLTIDVDDDTPLAANDSNSIPSGQFGPVIGNVITNDDPGADGFGLVTGIVSDGTGNSDVASDGANNYVVQGDYGVLTINEDGSYSYLRDAGTPGGVSDSFTYTYVDGDGDTVTAVLTITIGDSTPDVPENVNVLVDDDDVGTEGNPGGTGDDAPANTSGSVAAVGGDGTITYTLSDAGAPAGFTYQLQGDGSLHIIQDSTGDHVLTVTLDANGDYTVTQVNPIVHAAGSDENNLITDLVVTFTATDEDGGSDSGTLTIDVDDDTPLAANDSNSIPSGQFGPVIGNVITNDDPGADGFGLVTGIVSDGTGNSDVASDGANNYVVQGDYGVLTINEDGSYSYLRDAGTPGGVSNSFTYTYVDGDGDTVTAVLTITIGDSTPDVPENVNVLVDDDDVGTEGNPGGTGDDAPANTSGSVAAVGGDGTITYTLSDAGAPAGFTYQLQGDGSLHIIQDSTGDHVLTVTLDANGDYTVTQVNPIVHAAGSDENNLITDLVVTFTATDEDGGSDSGTLTIDVDDDTPLAANDSNSIPSGQFGPVIGNVITNDDPGADGFGLVTGIVSDGTGNSDVASDGANNYVVQGDYGVLTINEDGSYSYLRDAGTPGGVSDSFTYTYVDGDGDTVTAVLTITIGDSTPDVPENVNVLVDDDDVGTEGNPGGTGDDAPANTSGSVAAVGGDGTITYTLSDAGAPAGFTYQLQGDGSLHIIQDSTGDHVLTVTLDANGDYTVTQVNPIVHAAGSDENNLITDLVVTFTATDEDGGSDSGTLTIDVDDDTPLAANDSNSIPSGQFGPVIGNVITNDDPGADGFGLVTGIVSDGTGNSDVASDGANNYVVQGDYGVLTINEDGSYSYLRDAGTPGGVSDSFTYTYVDGDGDTVTAVLTITIGDSTPDVPENVNVLVDDDDVGTEGNPGGTGDDAPANTSGSVAAVGGDGTITYTLSDAGAPAGFTYQLQGDGSLHIIQDSTGDHVLTVTLDANGDYTVTQVNPIVHAAGSDENNLITDLVVTFTATDEDGGSDSGTLTIDVDDDTPVDFDPTDAVIANEAGPESPDIALNFAANAGADGVGDVVFNPTIDGDLALSSDGKTLQFEGEDITYVLVDPYTLEGRNESGDLAFTIRIDPATDTYTVDLEGPIYNISQSSFENVSGIGGGNDNYVALTASTSGGTSEDILISGSDSVNTNDNNIGIGAGQNIEGSETIKFEFKLNIVEDITPPLDPTGFTDDGFYQAFEYIQEVDVVSGAPGNTAGFDITIENALGAAPTNVTVTIYNGDPNAGGTVVDSFTDNADGTVTVPDGVVQEGYYVVVTSTDPFTSVEYSNNTGDPYKLGEIQVEVANTLEEFDAEIPIIGTDGDGDAVGSEIIITFDPIDSNGFAAASLMAEDSQSQSADMSAALVPSNDNADNGRAFVAGNQAVLMGAIAAAGIEISGRVADARSIIDDIRGETMQASGANQAAMVNAQGGQDASGLAVVASADASANAASAELQGGSASPAGNDASTGLDSANDYQAQAVSALAAGTDAHAGSDHAASAMTAAAVTMPGVEMIAALEAAHQSVSASGNASVASNQEVGRVLADALAGGNGPDIGALVDAIGGGGADSAREALASLKAAGVSNGHMDEAWGFAKGHEALSLDALALHHDAPPAA